MINLNGILNVLKPTGMSSHDVVSFVRKALNIKKVGHTGTLDPNAAGVLPICLGKGTKISQYLINDRKKYRAELTLGIQTDTQDKYGKVINSSNNVVSKEEIYNAFNEFLGEIHQIPPMFSALKHKGKKLYELARENIHITREPRKVKIYDLNIIHIKENKIIFDVECSKGTYIRTLCNDIGNYLKTYGHMSMLIRTKVGVFNLSDIYTLEEIQNKAYNGKIKEILKPLDYPLVNYNSFYIDDSLFNIITNGGKVQIKDKNLKNIKKLKVYCRGNFIGIGNVIETDNKIFVKIDKMLF